MNVRIQKTMLFTAGVFYMNELRMNNYRVTLKMVTVSNDPEEQNIALDRVKFFIHSALTDCVFIDQDQTESCERLVNAGVKICTLPAEPVDQVVGIMLYSKLNAIMEDRMVLAEIEISSELGDSIVYLHNSEESIGPLEEPGWWDDSESNYCDYTKFVNDKVLTIKTFPTWKDLELNWDTDTVINVDGDNRIVFADFNKDETR